MSRFMRESLYLFPAESTIKQLINISKHFEHLGCNLYVSSKWNFISSDYTIKTLLLVLLIIVVWSYIKIIKWTVSHSHCSLGQICVRWVSWMGLCTISKINMDPGCRAIHRDIPSHFLNKHSWLLIVTSRYILVYSVKIEALSILRQSLL